MSDTDSEPDLPRELDHDHIQPLPPGPSVSAPIFPATTRHTNLQTCPIPAVIPTIPADIQINAASTVATDNQLTPAQVAFLQAYANNSNVARPSKSSKKSKRKKKSKKQASSGNSSSSSSSSNSTSSSSSEDDESSNWSILRNMWPVEKRPLGLQNKDAFNAISMENLLCLAKFDKQNLKAIDGDLSSSFIPDRKPKTTTFKKSKDNGFKKLHPARFQRLPLSNIKEWWKHVPKIRSHQYKNLDLKFSGGNNKLTQKTIQALHDRTKCLQFKMFLSSNVNVSNKPVKKIERREDEGIVSTLDFAWENPTSLSQITDGMLNYCTALHHVWPYDPTGLIIMRIVNKYNFASSAPSMSERISVITAFINSVLRENATRAIRKDVIMSHEEQEEALKSILVTSGYNSTVPSNFRNPRNEVDNQSRSKFTPQPSRTNFRLSNPTLKPKINVVLHRGTPICFNYNTESCRNPSSSVGCKDSKSGKDFAHVCNKWLQTRNTHCFAPHPRAKHI